MVFWHLVLGLAQSGAMNIWDVLSPGERVKLEPSARGFLHTGRASTFNDP